jgi:hypothetical protein
MNQQLSRSVSAPFQASERQVLIKYWQDLQTKNDQVALMRKIENWKIANSNDQGFHQPPSPTNSPKKTLFPVSFDSSDDEKDVSSDSIDSGQELPSYVSFDQEKFADFSVFDQSFSVDVRRKSDSSENSSSLSGSSGIGERTTSSGSEVRKTPPPQTSVKYDAIAQLDLEMKIHQRKQENTYRKSVYKPVPKAFTPLTTGQQLFGVAPMNTYRKTKTLNRNVSLPTLPEGIPASSKHPFYPKRNSHHVLQRVQSSFGMQSSNLMFK